MITSPQFRKNHLNIMKFKIVFDVCTFNGVEKPNYNLSFEADNAEDAQEKVIDFIESMGGIHGNIISIQKIDAIPLPGIGIIKISNS
jgi:hypothetical protein